MKKPLIIAAVIGLICSTAAFSLGLGIVGSLPIGEGLPGNSLMASLKFNGEPFVIGLGAGLKPSYIVTTFDWWLIHANLVGPLNIYIGPGLYAALNTSTKNILFHFGAKVPIGLSLFPVKWFELFFEIAPTITVLPTLLGLGAQAALGLRFWF